jgi:nuclear pore complex protein Nup205
MLFDLLHVLPVTLRSPVIQESTSILLSEAVLSVVMKLREDRYHQALIQRTGGDADAVLPEERLYTLLQSVLECILDNNHLELVCGNLYAALFNHLHPIASRLSSTDVMSSS